MKKFKPKEFKKKSIMKIHAELHKMSTHDFFYFQQAKQLLKGDKNGI